METDNSYNYKVFFTWKKSFPKIKGSKEKIAKQNIKVAFESEPSEYDLERKVKDYIDSMERFMSDLDIRLEFNEIFKVQKLKVVKGSKDNAGDIDELSDFFGR